MRCQSVLVKVGLAPMARSTRGGLGERLGVSPMAVTLAFQGGFVVDSVLVFDFRAS